MKYLLYSLDRSAIREPATPLVPGRIVRFSPFNPYRALGAFRAGGSEYLKVLVLATWSLLARVATLRDISVWAYVGESGKLLHFSIVSPARMHMPWLPQEEAGMEIGGCVTIAPARGKKIYPHVLSEIAKDVDYDTPVYMIVDAQNQASRAGMDRAGMRVRIEVQKKRRAFGPPVYEGFSNGVAKNDGEWMNQ